MNFWVVLGSIAAAAWTVVALLPWQAHRTRERIGAAARSCSLADVTVLIPARNEAAQIEQCLGALSDQGSGLHAIVIDDRSEDETSRIALRCAEAARQHASGPTIEVVSGSELPPGWGGKLWALQQGFERADRPWCLLLDADIALSPRILAALLAVAKNEDAELVSVMARLRCESFWEKLLVPPFIFFFKLLYPFALVARRNSWVAAAAGGCILVRTAALRDVGAFASYADALIDDCTLARRVKSSGRGIKLVLSDDVISLRAYERLSEFWGMVSRTAFTQLQYSSVLLLATTAVMLTVFLAPVAAIFLSGNVMAVAISALALLMMQVDFAPVARFYGLSLVWRCMLPVAGVLYLAMTVHSALNYYTGTRATWKARSYGANE